MNYLDFIFVLLFLIFIVAIRYLKLEIANQKTKENLNFTIEELTLLNSFDTNDYRSEIVLSVIGFLAFAISTKYANFWLKGIIYLSALNLCNFINQYLMMKTFFQQPFFEDENLYKNENVDLIETELEEKLRKVKLLGKENSVTKKLTIIEFIKNKIEHTKIKKLILFIYFRSIIQIQILLVINAVIYLYFIKK